ncbi:uncharacterized protein LOC108455139 [Gossypium arboreum]|uniref:uncharacterized protein LOC108455139 n=1 Tax=Gossypium arboreum TaxID=29729 RepID=UPI0008190D6E|nr:uncharacterized protein LOC108455139 [Gossypium arboreum]
MVASEYERCNHFEDGLRDNLRVLIALQKEHDFSALVEKAKIVEKVKGAEGQNYDRERGKNKRDSKPSSSAQRPKKKAKVDGSVGARPSVTVTRLQPCTDCGRRHQDECWRITRACLRCGSLEHRIRECPLRTDQRQPLNTGTTQPYRVVQQPPRGVDRPEVAEARQPTLVYAAHFRENEDTPKVITGTFFILDAPYITLINIGSTNSYIASNISGNLKILVESTTSEVTVLNPLGHSVRVSKLYRDVPLEVQRAIFLTDLIVLPFRVFDLILGMDWLVKHRVSMDCATKRVVLRTEEVVIIGERWNYLSNVISALVAKKMIRKGCEVFLAYVNVSNSGDSTVKDIKAVKDFLDVFLEEILGLPPNCELEFGIELLPVQL